MTIQLILKTQGCSLGPLLPAHCQVANAEATDLTLSYFFLSTKVAEVQYTGDIFFNFAVCIIKSFSHHIFPSSEGILLIGGFPHFSFTDSTLCKNQQLQA